MSERDAGNMMDGLVLIRGAGDLASGVAARLERSGFPVVMTELPQPLMVRRTVCFGEAVYAREIRIEEITARLAPDADTALSLAAAGVIPVLVDPDGRCRARLMPHVVVDGIMAKRNTGTRITDAPLVIALGPGFIAGEDCHAVIETNRGHFLGRVIWDGSAEADTRTPAEIGGRKEQRALHAPVSGILRAHARIGDRLDAGDLIATVGGEPMRATFPGVLRGLIHDGLTVSAGLKIGDVDARATVEHCFTISDKSLAVAGGVLEAILSYHAGRPR
jgi:xanthine dehydrogenase accessory factor